MILIDSQWELIQKMVQDINFKFFVSEQHGILNAVLQSKWERLYKIAQTHRTTYNEHEQEVLNFFRNEYIWYEKGVIEGRKAVYKRMNNQWSTGTIVRLEGGKLMYQCDTTNELFPLTTGVKLLKE